MAQDHAIEVLPGPRLSPRRESTYILAICLASLALSLWLRPDPRGYGTHQELLMPPCFFHMVTGQPCPFCGMTTGFAYMVRGQFGGALRCNLMAPLAFGLAIVISLLALFGVVFDRPWVPGFVRSPRFSRALLVVILTFWVANLILHWTLWG